MSTGVREVDAGGATAAGVRVAMPGDAMTRRQRLRLVLVLGSLIAIGPLTIDLYLPVAMAVVRDLFSGAAFARLLSRLLLVMGAAPVLAPTLGSALLNWTTWEGVFVALAASGVVLTVVAATGLPETLPARRRRRRRPAGVLRSYAGLVRDRGFVSPALVAGLSMGAVFGFVAGSPFVLQEQYGLSEQQFGLVFGVGAAGLITGTQVNARLLRRYRPDQLLVTALVVASTAGLVLLWSAVTGAGGLPGVFAPLWLVLVAAGFVTPNAAALAMSDHGEEAGTAAALLGALQFTLAALTAPVVGMLGGDARAMALVIAGVTATATAIAHLVIRPEPGRAGVQPDKPAAAPPEGPAVTALPSR